jgi:hypothetical protein
MELVLRGFLNTETPSVSSTLQHLHHRRNRVKPKLRVKQSDFINLTLYYGIDALEAYKRAGFEIIIEDDFSSAPLSKVWH